MTSADVNELAEPGPMGPCENGNLTSPVEPVSKPNRQPPERADFQVHRADTALFATLQGLQMQSGVPISRLCRLALKELADNALDAADAAGRPGEVSIRAFEDGSYVIEDQGSGIPGRPEQLAALFAISRPMISGKFWRKPERGALGNGLRIVVGCIAATGGTVAVASHGRRVLLRPLKSGRTEIVETTEVDRQVGTQIGVHFGDDLPADSNDLVWAKNAITVSQQAGPPYTREASPHWFDVEQLAEMLAVIEPAETTVRQVVERLDGCSGAKAGLLAAPFGKNRTCRSMSEDDTAALLTALQAAARTVKPEALGPVGKEALGSTDSGYARACDSFVYGPRAPRATIPFIVEAWVTVFDKKGTGAAITVLANRTPIVADIVANRTGIDRKALRLSGANLPYSEAIELPKGDCDIVLHVTSPLIPIASIGKRPDLSVFWPAIEASIKQAFGRSRNKLPPDPGDPKPDPVKPEKPPTHKSVVLDHLDEAIRDTSEDGTYSFSQRNLFYRVRPYIEQETGGKLEWQNFTSILTDYEAEHGDIPGLIRDARGSFHDLSASIELGTTAVSQYGRPTWEYHKVLFCEKEDHVRILQQAGWPQRHDCAVMSSKGYGSRAARDLIDRIAETADREPVTVFIIHDADAAGTMIAQSLQEATRARGRRKIEIVDLGLQPWDALARGLQVEDVEHKRPQPVAQYVLRRSDGEHWKAWLQHHRVELNAMTPGELIRWLDDNVEGHGVAKIVPPSDIVAAALRDRIEERIWQEERLRVLRDAEKAIDAATQARSEAVDPSIPGGAYLVADIRQEVMATRELHWKDVVAGRAQELVAGATRGAS